MAEQTMRSDAARSRVRILEAARSCGSDVRLNEVARVAGVGVGTVYRHFPTVHSLVAALSTESLHTLADIARTASSNPDPGAGFEHLITQSLRLQLDDAGLQAVLVSTDEDSSEIRDLKADIFTTCTELLERARAAGAVPADLTLQSLQPLVCGIEHAARLGGDADLYLRIMFAGLRA